VVLVALGGVISLGFLPVWAEESARNEYVDAAAEISLELGVDHPLGEMDEVLSRLSTRLEPLANNDPTHDVGVKANHVLAALTDMRSDCQQAGELYELLPWQKQADCELVWSQLETLQARSEAFRGPLERLRGEVGVFVGEASSKQEQLTTIGPSQEAYDLATAMRSDYQTMPQLLGRSMLSFTVTSDPAGARVTYGGLTYSAKTPLEVRMPLSGTRQLEVHKRGYKKYRKVISFDTLQGLPEFSVTLIKEAPVDDVGKPLVPVVRGTRRPGRISSSGGDSRTDTPRKPKTTSKRAAQVQLLDGYVRGKRNPKIKFVQDKTYFSKGSMAIKLSPRYQANVKAISRIRGTKVFLEAFTVELYVKRRKGWRKEYTKSITLDEPLQRAVVQYSGGVRKVQVVSRALRLEPDELKDDVKDALKHAIKTVLSRDKAGR
ncbi:MAG: PEGA domain-containing protein, partial [Gemmatimonadales bacterium]|nr:PEGA domain-containing protein [Gemmatimonadales bacterium]